MANKTPDSVIAEAYNLYIKGESITTIAKTLKLNPHTVRKYQKKDNWAKRKTKNLERIQQRADTQLIENAKKRKRRHEKQYQLLQKKGSEALIGGKDRDGNIIEPVEVEDARTAASLLDMGIKGERMVMGDDQDDQSGIVEITMKLPIELIGRI